MITQPIIQIKNLHFYYDQKKVFDQLNLVVNQGDFICLIGANGTGKSTLVKLLLGQLKTPYGTLSLWNKSLDSFKDWHKVGYISQKAVAYSLGFPATVREIIAAHVYAQVFLGMKKAALEKKINESLKIVGLDNNENELLGNLSGGQQQKVFLARTLVNNPQLLILDEPMSGIDSPSQKELLSLLFHLNKNLGITIIMVTHDLSFLSNNSCRVVCLDNYQAFEHHSPLPQNKTLFCEHNNLIHHSH